MQHLPDQQRPWIAEPAQDAGVQHTYQLLVYPEEKALQHVPAAGHHPHLKKQRGLLTLFNFAGV